MARFITTTEISFQIEKIISEAKLAVVIVSPYLKFHNRLEQIIEKQLNQKVDFYFVYKECDVKNQTKQWFEKTSSKYNNRIRLINKSNLHAKCYINES